MDRLYFHCLSNFDFWSCNSSNQSSVHMIFLKQNKTTVKRWKTAKKKSEVAYNLFVHHIQNSRKFFLTSGLYISYRNIKTRFLLLLLHRDWAAITLRQIQHKVHIVINLLQNPGILKLQNGMCICKAIINFSLINTIFSNSAGEVLAISQSRIK